MTRVDVMVCSDPSVFRLGATVLELCSYANNLGKLLSKEFGCVVCLHFGTEEESTSSDPIVSERIREIETSDEWRKLFP